MADEKNKSLYSLDPGRWWYARLVFFPTLLWNILLGRVLGLRRWWDRVDDHVIIGALPFGRDVGKLKSLGITGVVNTCDEYAGPIQGYEALEMEQLRVRTIDFTPPSLESVERAVAFIEKHAGRGGQVYVHCKAGRGRSATVVACWLMKARQMSPDEAQLLLLSVRPHVNRHLVQRQVIKDFYAKLGPQSDSTA